MVEYFATVHGLQGLLSHLCILKLNKAVVHIVLLLAKGSKL